MRDGEFDQRRASSATAGGRRSRAKAVVVAAGGFEANHPLAQGVLGRRGRQLHHPRHAVQPGPDAGRPARAGALPVGDPNASSTPWRVDARAPKFDGGIVTRLDSVPFGIVVNRDGERFYDEGEDFWPKRYAIWGGLIARQPDQIAYSIIDAKASASSCRRSIRRSRPARSASWPTKLGLDRAAVVATVETLNQATPARHLRPGRSSTTARTEGLDPPKSHWALPIEDAAVLGLTRCGRASPSPTMASTVNERRAGHHAGRCGRRTNIFAAGEIMAGNILGRGLPGRLRADHRDRLRADRGKGGGASCRELELIEEAERQMVICNACRYCEGYCAVFPAMELRRDLHRARPRLPGQPLLRLPRLLLRLPVRAAARIRGQRAADLRRDPGGDLPRLQLAAACSPGCSDETGSPSASITRRQRRSSSWRSCSLSRGPATLFCGSQSARAPSTG